MKTVTLYDPATGAITGRYRGAAPERALQPGQAFVVGDHDPEAVFIQDGRVVALQAMDLRVDGHTISGLPPNAAVEIEGRRYVVDNGFAELAFSHPGPYSVRVAAPGFRAITIDLP